MTELPYPYLLFLGDVTSPANAKTAFGLRDWAADRCIGEYSLPQATVTTGLPVLTPTLARARGARSMVIGVAPTRGVISESWIPALLAALEAGLDLVSGMHTRLTDVPPLQSWAKRLGRKLIDVRLPPANLPVGNGKKRTGKRLLTVGTDCALGKKYTALVLTRELGRRGIAADFRATGQTGIMIAGSGIPLDSVVADFIAGAAETLTPDAAPDHWDVVEGQGSVFHPAYAGVSLGLLHGTQPDVIVMCHAVGRDRMLNTEHYATPGILEAIELTLTLGRRTNTTIRCAAVSLNTSSLSEAAARDAMATLSAKTGLPVADPMRSGRELDRMVDACLE